MRIFNIEDMLLVNADGEIPELTRYFYYKMNGRVYRLGQKDFFRKAFNMPNENPTIVWNRLMMRSKCSAMIKLIRDEEGNIKDLLSGHTAWSEYTETYRTMKQ
jgi:hypothetical protein